jgi:hypothetical protein
MDTLERGQLSHPKPTGIIPHPAPRWGSRDRGRSAIEFAREGTQQTDAAPAGGSKAGTNSHIHLPLDSKLTRDYRRL